MKYTFFSLLILSAISAHPINYKLKADLQNNSSDFYETKNEIKKMEVYFACDARIPKGFESAIRNNSEITIYDFKWELFLTHDYDSQWNLIECNSYQITITFSGSTDLLKEKIKEQMAREYNVSDSYWFKML